MKPNILHETIIWDLIQDNFLYYQSHKRELGHMGQRELDTITETCSLYETVGSSHGDRGLLEPKSCQFVLELPLAARRRGSCVLGVKLRYEFSSRSDPERFLLCLTLALIPSF